MQHQRIGYLRGHSERSLFASLFLLIVVFPTILEATQVNIAVTNNHVNTIINRESSLHNSKPGRHVCKQERVVQVPVKHPQTYTRPAYRRTTEPCVGSSSGYCSVVRVVYQTAIRHIIRMETKHEVMYTCCLGWSRLRNEETDCLKPICDAGCRNGGECVAPNECRCTPQWSGKLCENDVDECAAKTDKCQQICHNQDGAYTCGCHQGFSLQNDGRSCALCLACSPEFKQMQADYKQLNRRVIRAEKEKNQIRKNVNKLKRTLRRCARNKCKRQRPSVHPELRRTSHWTTPMTPSTKTTEKPTTPTTVTTTIEPTTTTESTTQSTTTTTPTPTTSEPVPDYIKRTAYPITDTPLKSIEYMINSLSGQIGILEERIEECNCQGNRRPEEYYDQIS